MVDAGADRASAARLLELCRRKKLTDRDRGILHRRPRRRDADRNPRLVRRGRPRLRHLHATRPSRRCSAFPPATLDDFGAVSRETAEAMAKGALAHSPAELAVSVTGIAGPGGGSRTSRSGSCISPPPRERGALIHREKRFGDIGRAQVRHAVGGRGARDAARACRSATAAPSASVPSFLRRIAPRMSE